MKNTIVIISFLVSLQLHAQKYFTRTGVTEFEASEKAFEPVEATNKSTTAIIDTKKGVVVAQVFMVGFQFKNALMQEHFNENYMDTHQYPKAIFKGRLIDFSLLKLNTNSTFDLDGILTIKGIEKKIKTVVTIQKLKNNLNLSGSLFVSPEDFDIKIPSIVRDKIAKQIQISIDYELIEKK